MYKALIRIILLSFLMLGMVYAYVDNSGSNYPSNDPNNQNINNQNNSSNQQQQKLLESMNKKTKQALKTFKGLIDNKDAAKSDFFATEGQNPTADEFEAGSSDDVVTQTKFKITNKDLKGDF